MINKLVDHGNKLLLGYIDVSTAYELGRGIQSSIDKTQTAIQSYFGIPFPFETDDCLPALRAFVSKQADVIDVGLEGFLAAAATQTLHEVFISSVNEPENYSELSDYRKQLSKFLSTIGNHKPDESTMVKSRLSKKLSFAKELKEKIEVALDEPSTSLVKLKILSEDFCIILKLYMEWSSVVMWNDSEFAFTQEVGFSLKERLP